MASLEIKNFAHVEHASFAFGDLTVLVGPQGSGKSIALQLLKMALDREEIVNALRDAGHPLDDRGDFLDLYFGQGMRSAWRAETEVKYDGRPVRFDRRRRTMPSERGLFYIPAHRATLVSEGWPAPFLKLGADTPAVARLYSQNLFELFSNPRSNRLFPVARRLKKVYRDAIDRAVFHGGEVRLSREGLRKRLELHHGDARLPFMTWTAGQREFTPLLLGLYHLLPERKKRKQDDINWVVIEEPEMGLHPRAIAVVMLLVLDLLWRGYRVVVSTHAPLVLETMWMLRVLRENGASSTEVAKAFGIEHNNAIRQVMETALGSELKTYYMSFGDAGKVRSKDISSLDPFAADEAEADWGGLTEWSTAFNDAIARSVRD